jgi:molybdenum cofactor guanylyltransferase
MQQTAGIILCGGQSSRMGRMKAMLPFGSEPMLARVVRLLNPVVSPIVVVAARGQELPPFLAGVTMACDAQPGRGPLQGLAAGLEALLGRAETAFVSSCDVPFLQPAFVQRMIELLGDQHAAVPVVGGCRHPLAAVYRVSVLGAAHQLLAEGQMRLASLLDLVPTRFVTEQELMQVDPDLQTLRNLNTPQDYEAALQSLCSSHSA